MTNRAKIQNRRLNRGICIGGFKFGDVLRVHYLLNYACWAKTLEHGVRISLESTLSHIEF